MSLYALGVRPASPLVDCVERGSAFARGQDPASIGALHALGATRVGAGHYVSFGDATQQISDMWHQLNALQPPSAAQALNMAQRGKALAAAAKTKALDVGGDAMQQQADDADQTWWKLDWHEKQAQALKSSKGDAAPYPSGDDLKNWLVHAFVVGDAVQEGGLYLQQAWDQMWSDMGTGVLQLPGKILTAAGKAVATVVGSMPWWIKLAGGLVLAGGAAYGGTRVYGAIKTARKVVP